MIYVRCGCIYNSNNSTLHMHMHFFFTQVLLLLQHSVHLSHLLLQTILNGHLESMILVCTGLSYLSVGKCQLLSCLVFSKSVHNTMRMKTYVRLCGFGVKLQHIKARKKDLRPYILHDVYYL